MSGRATIAVHVLAAASAHVYLVRALHQGWAREVIVDEPARLGFLVVLPLVSALASLLAIWIGARIGDTRGALIRDLAGIAFFLGAVIYLHLGPLTRDVVGIVYVLVLVARLAPSLASILRGRERGAVAVLAVSVLWYAGAATWSGAATAAQGDQPHYLLAADALAHGRIDLVGEYADGAAFRALSGVPFSDDDAQTHLVVRPSGTFLVQGYGLALALVPGWVLGGKLGALLIVALMAALASHQTFVLCREVCRDERAAAIAWALVAFLAPVVTIASVIYPNALGALLVVLTYRWLFTAPIRRPVLAALAAAATLTLTPRDLVAVGLLAPFLVFGGAALGRAALLRAGATFAAAVVAISLLDLATYGLALPYAGYVFGTEQAQRLDGMSSFTFAPHLALAGILFDRAFGIAGSAPFLFVGLAGIVPALRTKRAELLPALVAVGGSLAALSVYRLWQGGWSPPNRYIVDVLPLWAPFLAFAIAALRGPVWRGVAAVLVVLSASATFFLIAIPNLAFNVADTAHLVEALDSALVVDPFAWLPSFGAPMAPRAEVVLTNFEVALATRWLPYALALLALLAFVLARGAPRPATIWKRAALGLLAVPLTGATLRYGGQLQTDQLGAPYVALALGIGVFGVITLFEQRALRTDSAIGVLLGATVLASSLALLPFERSAQPPESDEPHYLIVMQSLASDRSFDVKHAYDAETYRAFYPVRLKDRHVIDVGSAQYPIHDLGLPILGAVPFAIAGRDGVLALMCVLASLIAWRGYALLRALAFGRDIALLAAGGAALLHPIYTYTTQIYPELASALVVLLVAERLVRPTARDLAIASALAGTLPWLSVRGWFPAAGLGVVIAFVALSAFARERSPRTMRLVISAAAPVVVVIGAFVALEWALFRVAVPNVGYFVIRDQQTVVSLTPHIGLAGLFLDRAFGLLPHTPLYLIAFAGAAALVRRARSVGPAAIGALAAAFIASNLYLANVAYWWADGSPPSRYELATMALPLVALAAGIERLRGPIARGLAVVALIWSAGVTYVFALSPLLRYDIAEDVRASGLPGRFWTMIGGALRDDPGTAFPSIVRGATTDLVLTLAWISVLAFIVMLGARRPRTHGV